MARHGGRLEEVGSQGAVDTRAVVFHAQLTVIVGPRQAHPQVARGGMAQGVFQQRHQRLANAYGIALYL